MNRIITLKPSENIIDGNFSDNDIVLVKCDATDEAFSFTMPSATGLNNVTFIIKKIDSSTNAVTIQFNGDETLDGVTSKTLPEQYDSVSIIGDYDIYFEHGAIGSNVISDNPTFVGATLSGMTKGSVFFAGDGGQILENNTGFFWDNVNNRLGLNTTTPFGLIHINGGFGLSNGIVFGDGDSGIYEISDDILGIYLKGKLRARFQDTAGLYFGTTSVYPRIGLHDGSTYPNYMPISGDDNTGIGRGTSGDDLKLYAGGEVMWWKEVGGVGTFSPLSDTAWFKVGAQDDAGYTYNGSNWLFNPKLVGTGVMLADTDSKWCFRDTAIGMYSQADGYGDLFADISWRIGNSVSGAPTNYINISSNGDISFFGTAGFYPVRIAQSAQPTPDSGELIIWRDTDDGKVYLVYNDTDSGVKQVEMI